MNVSFMEKSIVNRCAKILGISDADMTRIFERDVDTISYIRRRISFGIHGVDDNIGCALKGILLREANDFSKINAEEVKYIRERYNVDIEWANSKKSLILSEKEDPLILGFVGESLLREFAKTLKISRRDAIKLIKSNNSVKSYMQKEKTLVLIDRRSSLSVILQNTLKRERNDFSSMNKDEMLRVYNEFGIIIGNQNFNNARKING